MVIIVILCLSGFVVICFKGNCKRKLEDCIWERMETEIKKKGGRREVIEGGKDGKWFGVKLEKSSRDGSWVDLFLCWRKLLRFF